MGLAIAAQGVAGLFREDREVLLLWLSVLNALLVVLYLLLVEVYLYMMGELLLAGLLPTVIALIQLGQWMRDRSRS